MKSLPFEGNTSFKKQQPSKRHSAVADPKIARHRKQIKIISQRLVQYANGAKMPEGEVIRLLADTRNQVISMHVARQSQSKKTHRRRQ